MQKTKGSAPRKKEIGLAIVRFMLGQAQIIGATMGFYFLIATGISEWTIGTVLVTGFFTVTSGFLFRGEKRNGPEHE